MNKQLIIGLFLLLAGHFLSAQSFDYGNGWYKSNPDQTYIKFQVNEDGIYRVTRQDLLNSGFDLAGVEADILRLIYRGQEKAMYVAKDANGELNFLEFFGKRNDGKLDSLLYRDPVSGIHLYNDDFTGRRINDLQPNKEFSLFTDTSTYYLTWKPGVFGLRILEYVDVSYGAYSAEPYFSYEGVLRFHPDSIKNR
ncbi:MAG: hypothetical protein AAGI38_22190, partial [Bacteroidota bacterium]